MFSMLLSSVTDADIEYWEAEITRYRTLLEMQSSGFETTKLAAARMALLAEISSGGRGEYGGLRMGRGDPRQAFCREFDVQLNTI